MNEYYKYYHYRHIFWTFLGFLFSFLLLEEFFGPSHGVKPTTIILMLSGSILAGLLIIKILSFFGLYDFYNAYYYYNIPEYNEEKQKHKSLLWAFIGILIGSVFTDWGINDGYYSEIVFGLIFWSGILIWIGLKIFQSVKEKRKATKQKKIIAQQVSIKPAMGVVNIDSSVYEPNIDIYFTRKITDNEVRILNNVILPQKDSERDRSTVYNIDLERISMNVYNVTTLQSHDKFISKVKKIIETLDNKEQCNHLYSYIDISIRQLWNFGNPLGGATKTYEQVINNSSNFQNPKVIRSLGDYSTLEEFEMALKKSLGNLGYTVRYATNHKNSDKSSKTFETKFFN